MKLFLSERLSQESFTTKMTVKVKIISRSDILGCALFACTQGLISEGKKNITNK